MGRRYSRQATRLWPLTVAALSLLVATSSNVWPQSEYFRIRFSSGVTIYGEFRGAELRVATTAGGLQTASAVAATKSTRTAKRTGVLCSDGFPEVNLPLPAAERHAGWLRFAGRLSHLYYPGVQQATWVNATLGLERTDDRGATWTYWVERSGSTAPSPEQGPVLSVPGLDSLNLKVSTQIARRRYLKAGVRVWADGAELCDVSRNGSSADVQFDAIMSDGNTVVAQKRGPLRRSGFT